MNSIPKYRVYDTTLKTWIESVGFFGFFSKTILTKDHLGEIQEWTGLLDIVGTEIYEGDIVQATAEHEYKDDTGIYEVIYNSDECAYQLRGAGYSHGLSPTWGGWESLTVVGNTYETPELVPAPAEI